MKRSDFFKTLGIGLIAAPQLAKILAEEPLFTYHPMNQFRPGPRGFGYNPINYNGELEWHYIEDGLIYKLDAHPLRYTIERAWYPLK